MRKTMIYSSALISLLSLSACFSAPVSQPVNQALNPAGLAPVGEASQAAKVIQPSQVKVSQQGAETIFDLGTEGKASFSFTINLAAGSGSFTTKVSSSGRANKAAGDVTQFKLHLLDLGGVPAFDSVHNQLDPAVVKFSSALIPRTANPQTFTFKNVPTSGASGANHYYLAVEALEGATNITNDTPLTPAQITGLPAGEQNRVIIDSNGPAIGGLVYAYRSNGGGDDPTNAGGIQVGNAPSYTIAGPQQDQITTFLRVWDIQGATLDSQVTVNSGQTSYQGTIAVQ